MEKTSSTGSAVFQRHEDATLPSIAEPETVWELNRGAGFVVGFTTWLMNSFDACNVRGPRFLLLKE